MKPRPGEFMGMRRMAVDVTGYEATLTWWLDRLRQWRHAMTHPVPVDLSKMDGFAPTRMNLAYRWMPRDPEAERFVTETLALTNWPVTPQEERLGRSASTPVHVSPEARARCSSVRARRHCS
jgi:hypothetical protein